MSSAISTTQSSLIPESVARPVEAADHDWYPGIEVLRGIAATAVVIAHCYALANPTASGGFISYILLGLGDWGVDLFFILSGFLLAEFFWSGKGKRTSLEFFVRRFFRIAPAYYVCVAILFLFFASHALLFSAQGAKQISANATFTQWLWPTTASNLNVDGSLWTLTIEMLLYLSMPVLAWLIAKRPLIASLILIGIGIGYRLFVALGGSGYQDWRFGSSSSVNVEVARLFLGRQFFGFLPIFVLGMGIRWALMHGYLRRWTRPSSTGPSVGLVLLLLLPGIAFLRECVRASQYQHWFWFTFYDFAICLLIVPALIYAARPFRGRAKLSLRSGVWLGERSYGLYLWHFPVILSFYAIGSVGNPPELNYIGWRLSGIAIVSLGLAAASYSFVERPLRLHGRTYAKKVASWSLSRKSKSRPKHAFAGGSETVPGPS